MSIPYKDATSTTAYLATSAGDGSSGNPFKSQASVGIGTPADTAATDGTSSWTMISLLKAICKSILTAALGIPIYDSYAAPVTTTWNSTTALNTAQAVTVSGQDTVVLTLVFTNSITAGVVTFEAYDGVTWVPIKGFRCESYLSDQTYSLVSASGSRSWQFSVAGFSQFRTRLSNQITGAGSLAVTHLVSSAPDVSGVTAGLDPNQPLPAGSNQIGSVSLAAATTGGYQPYHYVSAATNNLTAAKASAGQIGSLIATNTSTSQAAYIHFYDSAAATVGSTAVKKMVPVPAAPNAQQPTVVALSFPGGVAFANGISFSITLGPGDTDNTALTVAGQVFLDFDKA